MWPPANLPNLSTTLHAPNSIAGKWKLLEAPFCLAYPKLFHNILYAHLSPHLATGTTATWPEALYDQPSSKPSHSIKLFHLLLFATPEQPPTGHLGAEGHRAANLFAVSGAVVGNLDHHKDLILTLVTAVTKAAAWDHDPKRPPRAAETTESCCPAAAGHLFLHNPGELGY